LNHLPVTDWIWMQRLTSEGDAPDRLDAILFETFPPTCAAREAEDRQIIDYAGARSPDFPAAVAKTGRLNLAVDAGGCVVRLLPVGANVAKLCIPLS
jgi:hypothetical protein